MPVMGNYMVLPEIPWPLQFHARCREVSSTVNKPELSGGMSGRRRIVSTQTAKIIRKVSTESQTFPE